MPRLSPLPEATLRLFPNHLSEELSEPSGRSLLCEILLEDGDSADLRWLIGEVGVAGLSKGFAALGGRRLSRRSRAFWALILGLPSGPEIPAAAQLWLD